jgi:hypothetical protein
VGGSNTDGQGTGSQRPGAFFHFCPVVNRVCAVLESVERHAWARARTPVRRKWGQLQRPLQLVIIVCTHDDRVSFGSEMLYVFHSA